MIYEMESKSQKPGEGGAWEDEEAPVERGRKKRAELFQVRDEDRIIKQSYSAPTEREAIRVRSKSEGIPQNNILQCPTDVEATPIRLAKRIDDSTGTTFSGGEETRRLWIFDAVKPARLTSRILTHTQ